jgi:hypothetical protein
MSTDPTQIGFILKEKVASLQAALLAKHPTLPTLLREIHTTLKQYPEQITLLNPPEIAIIVQGLEKQTGVELVNQSLKGTGKASANQKIKSLGADAF